MWQDEKAELAQQLLGVAERATELETLLNDDLLRQQQELQYALGSADVEADRCHQVPLTVHLWHGVNVIFSWRWTSFLP